MSDEDRPVADDYISPEVAALVLRRSVATVWRRTAAGRLARHTVDGRTVFRREDVEALARPRREKEEEEVSDDTTPDTTPKLAFGLVALAQATLNTARDKGFDAPRWGDENGGASNYLSKLMLVVTEVVEAVDAEVSRDALAPELADIAIRLLGILEATAPGAWSPSRIEVRGSYTPPVFLRSAPEMVFPVVRYCAEAAEAWRRDNRTDATIACELALLTTFRLADTCGIDLMEAIFEKHEKNKTRAYRHGKKGNG